MTSDLRTIGNDSFARDLREFGPVGILAIVVISLVGNAWILPIGAILVLAWARLSHTPLRELGFVRPKSWPRTALFGILFGIAFKFVLKAVVLPLLGSDPINHTYHYLAGNTAALPGAVWMMIVSAGFGEETVFRGFFFERLQKLLGSATGAKMLIVIITSAVFAIAHYPDQGLWGAVQAAFTGMAFGTMFAVSRQIWLPMFAHAAFDLTALAIIYLNAEVAVAHLFFR